MNTQQSGSHNAHARFSPSDSPRWMTCTAAVQFEEELKEQGKLPEDKGSVDSTLGTLAHDYATAILTNDIEMLKGLDPLESDSAEAVGAYVAYCNSITPMGNIPFVESQVPLFYDKNEKGTSDFAVVTDDWIEVVDYKNGAGVYVQAEDNTQLAIYAASFIQEMSSDGLIDLQPDMEIRLTIMQPRHREHDGPDTWVLTWTDFQAFCHDIHKAHAIVDKGEDLTFEPGEKACRWCSAKSLCKAAIDDLTPPEFDSVDVMKKFKAIAPKEAKTMDVSTRITKREADLDNALNEDDVVWLWKNSKAIKAYLEDAGEWLLERALQGDPVPNTKLVAGREGNAAWTDEEAVDKFLGRKLKMAERYNMKLISPTAARKLFAEAPARTTSRLESLITRSPGSPSVAMESDKRPAIPCPADKFDDLDEDI